MDKTLITIQHYNLCAKSFAENYQVSGFKKKWLSKFSQLLPNEATILDVGCGPGNMLRFLVKQNKGYKIWGIDLSVEMINLARQNVPGGNFLLMDMRSLNLNGKFSAIIMSYCIIHLYHNETVDLLIKTSDLLHDNGYLYLSFPVGDRSGYERTDFSDKDLFLNYYSQKELSKILKNIGYKIIAKHWRFKRNLTGIPISKNIFIIAQK